MAYVYCYTNKLNKKIYIGSRTAKDVGPAEEDFNKKYFSSSRDPEFREAMANGELVGEILWEGNDKEKALGLEAEMIDFVWKTCGKDRSYNHYCNGTFSTAGRPISDYQKRRVSEVHKGKPQSEYQKQRISEAMKGNQHFLGHKQSDYCKQRARETHKGRPNPGVAKANKGNQHMLGHKQSDYCKQRVSETNSIPVLDTRTGITYPSRVAWAEAMGYKYTQAANYYIKKGILKKLQKNSPKG